MTPEVCLPDAATETPEADDGRTLKYVHFNYSYLLNKTSQTFADVCFSPFQALNLALAL